MSDEELVKFWVEKGLPRTVFEDFSKLPMKSFVDDLTSCGEMARRGLMGKVTDTVDRLTGRKLLSVWEVVDKYLNYFCITFYFQPLIDPRICPYQH
jgi:hypothetical protein